MLLYKYVERMRGRERKNAFLARKSFSKIHTLGSKLNHCGKKFCEDFSDLGAIREKEQRISKRRERAQVFNPHWTF